MIHLIEIIVSVLLIITVFIGGIRVYLFRKQNEGLAFGLISVLSILFGGSLYIFNGILLEYLEESLELNNNELLFKLGLITLITGLLYCIISIFRSLIWFIQKLKS